MGYGLTHVVKGESTQGTDPGAFIVQARQQFFAVFSKTYAFFCMYKNEPWEIPFTISRLSLHHELLMSFFGGDYDTINPNKHRNKSLFYKNLPDFVHLQHLHQNSLLLACLTAARNRRL